MNRRWVVQSLVVFLGVTLLSVAPGLGQSAVSDMTFTGEVEFGVRSFPGSLSFGERSKFEEYSDLSTGLFVRDMRLGLRTSDSRVSYELRALKVSDKDRNILVRGAKAGSYKLEFEWDQAPHRFSNTGLSPFVETSRGVFELDDALQSDLQAAASADQPALLESFIAANASSIGLNMQRNQARLNVKLTPTPEWDLGAQWSRTRKKDSRPMGFTFSFGPITEMAEPVEHTSNEVRLTGGVTRENWQLQLGYDLSSFKNDVDVLVADNPLRISDDATAGPIRGRLDLAPDNIAHNMNLTGATRLATNGRLTGTFAYGIRRQDDDFLPHTINSAIVDPLLTLPASSLDGDVRTVLANLQFATRPSQDVSLTVRYRYFNLDNQTQVLTFPARVRTDQRVVEGPFETAIYSYSKTDAGAEVSWRLARGVSLKLAHGWVQWNRNESVREVDKTNEHTPELSVDVRPADWLFVRTALSRSWRNGSDYDPVVDLQLPLLRKHDMADRNRTKVNFLARITPSAGPAFTATYIVKNDDYDESAYGLQEDESWTAGLDLSWPVSDGFDLFAGYTREAFDANQRSRARQASAVESTDNDWVGLNQDDVDTYTVGFDAAVVPGSLALQVAYDYSNARGAMLAFNPNTPAFATATATDFPEMKQKFHQLDASLRYSIRDAWFSRIRYVFERYDQDDFRINDVQTYVDATNIFLGARTPNYEAHSVELTVGYEF